MLKNLWTERNLFQICRQWNIDKQEFTRPMKVKASKDCLQQRQQYKYNAIYSLATVAHLTLRMLHALGYKVLRRDLAGHWASSATHKANEPNSWMDLDCLMFPPVQLNLAMLSEMNDSKTKPQNRSTFLGQGMWWLSDTVLCEIRKALSLEMHQRLWVRLALSQWRWWLLPTKNSFSGKTVQHSRALFVDKISPVACHIAPVWLSGAPWNI